MKLYTRKAATLNGTDGNGYAFLVPDAFHDDCQGVFFADREHAEVLEALLELPTVEFTGIMYKRTQAGTVRGVNKTLTVKVEKIVPVSLGLRANFRVTPEAEAEPES
jgi:hypothetical protein